MKGMCFECGNYNLCGWLKQLRHYKEFKVFKNRMPTLPVCLEETPLGDLKGALRQFRGPFGSHVHEYKGYWVFHRDKVDPRYDPVGHLVQDAPYVLGIVALFGLGIFLAVISLKEVETKNE
jgi:hypothetical protein